MGKLKRPDIMRKSDKIYDIGSYQIYKFNDRKLVIATSLEEATALFRDYQENDEDEWRGTSIKLVELISDIPISRKHEEINTL